VNTYRREQSSRQRPLRGLTGLTGFKTKEKDKNL
jgi:hypothetical protein